jgi:hypothetical protein
MPIVVDAMEAIAGSIRRPRRTRPRRGASGSGISVERDAADAIDAADVSAPDNAKHEFRAPGASEGLSDHWRPPLARAKSDECVPEPWRTRLAFGKPIKGDQMQRPASARQSCALLGRSFSRLAGRRVGRASCAVGLPTNVGEAERAVTSSVCERSANLPSPCCFMSSVQRSARARPHLARRRNRPGVHLRLRAVYGQQVR